jgi:hypothetical protein
MKLSVRFGYPTKMTSKGSQLLHELVCFEIDKIGETSQKPLGECVSAAVENLRGNNVISWIKAY